MTQAILRAFQAAMSSVFPTGVDNRMIQRMKAFSLGSMVASAAVSPILHESAGASYKIWLLDILVFFLVSAIFIWLHLEETINYGPFTLIVAAILFFAAPAPRQARFLPREFIPWLPAAIDIFLFTTVYSLPRIVELLRLFQDRPSSDMGESHSMVSQGFYVEPGSIHSWALSSSHREDFVMQSFIAHDVSNMQGSLSRTSSVPSVRESDIDLEEGLHAPRVILYRSGNRNNFHVPSESGVPSSRYPGGPVDDSSNQRDETPRPPSPQSELSQGSHSTIGDLITQPLLGQHSSLPLSI